MRIATWNIARRTHDLVAPTVAEFNADVVVMPEVARPDEAAERFQASDVCHVGTDEKSRLAVFTFNGYRCEVDHSVGWDPEKDLMWNLPVQITGDVDFRLLAVWSDNQHAERPTTQAIRHIQSSGWSASSPLVVAGDFNNHRKWDHDRDNEKDHKTTVELLCELGLTSAYHHARGLSEAKDLVEDHPTFWMHGHEDKPHHVDFIYAPAGSIRQSPDSVTVGTHESIVGNKLSDHAPIIADLDL